MTEVFCSSRDKHHRYLEGACFRLALLFMTACVLGSCDDDRTPTKVLIVPSPAGSAATQKTYNLINYHYELTLLPHAPSKEGQETLSREAPRSIPRFLADGVVVGWMGERHLTVGWPPGDAFEPGPARVGPIEIAYVNYELDLDRTTPRRTAQIVLHDVRYEATEQLSGSNVVCTIHVEGSDGKLFDKVDLRIEGYGFGQTRPANAEGGWGVGMTFALKPLTNNRSPELTPTQAKFG